MRNLELIVEPAAISERIYAEWRTEPFRRSHEDPRGYIRQWVERLAQVPRGFFDLSDPILEAQSFSQWFSSLPNYGHADPAKNDLNRLHDIVHVGAFRHSPADTHAQFEDRTRWNAFMANFVGNVLLYFYVPGAREVNPARRIWADRFLEDEVMFEEGRSNRTLAVQKPLNLLIGLTRARFKAILEPSEFREYQIRYFEMISTYFAEIWRGKFSSIESVMSTFMERARCDRHGAAAMLKEYLVEQQGDAICPFEPETREFFPHPTFTGDYKAAAEGYPDRIRRERYTRVEELMECLEQSDIEQHAGVPILMRALEGEEVSLTR